MKRNMSGSGLRAPHLTQGGAQCCPLLGEGQEHDDGMPILTSLVLMLSGLRKTLAAQSCFISALALSSLIWGLGLAQRRGPPDSVS